MLFDPTKLNVYQIKYQYLGAGSIEFFIEDPSTGRFQRVHQIQYANANTETHVANPSMPIRWNSTNTSNTTAIPIKGASGALFVEGIVKLTGAKYGAANNKSNVTTEVNIFTLKNCTTLNGVTNQAVIRLNSLSFAANGNSGTSISTIRVVRGATLGGSPNFTPVSGSTADNGVTLTSANSCVSVDTAGTTVTGGAAIYNGVCCDGTNAQVNLAELEFFIGPGETLTFAGKSVASNEVGIAASWVEDV